MCDYYLKGICFHPERVEKGLVGKPCEVHTCEQCTNKQWQQQKINEDFAYYTSILEAITSPKENSPQGTTIQENNSRSRKFPAFLLKNPLQGMFK